MKGQDKMKTKPIFCPQAFSSHDWDYYYDNPDRIPNQYLVMYHNESFDHNSCRICTAKDIFAVLDMDDCCDPGFISIHHIKSNGRHERCDWFGTWHNPKDPLRMEIRTTKGKVLDIGYGADH